MIEVYTMMRHMVHLWLDVERIIYVDVSTFPISETDEVGGFRCLGLEKFHFEVP